MPVIKHIKYKFILFIVNQLKNHCSIMKLIDHCKGNEWRHQNMDDRNIVFHSSLIVLSLHSSNKFVSLFVSLSLKYECEIYVCPYIVLKSKQVKTDHLVSKPKF